MVTRARTLLEKDHPTVVIESVSPEVVDLMSRLGYLREELPESPNVTYRYPEAR